VNIMAVRHMKARDMQINNEIEDGQTGTHFH
jgi:hypothetical protein